MLRGNAQPFDIILLDNNFGKDGLITGMDILKIFRNSFHYEGLITIISASSDKRLVARQKKGKNPNQSNKIENARYACKQ